MSGFSARPRTVQAGQPVGAQQGGGAAVASQRPTVEVAVGVLFDSQEQFLLTSRPAGKVYEGFWEFPGGKIEPGESVEQALRRELQEELGITIDSAQLWKVEVVEYPHARVRLHFCRVERWQGTLSMREGQRMAWQGLPVQVHPVLPGTIPVLNALAVQRQYTGPTHLQGSQAANPAWLDAVRWDAQGLVPVIAQEATTGDILMFAWMNREALAATVQRGQAVYYSRSRQKLWHKGEESGHYQQVQEVRLDCDNDVILLSVTQLGHEPGIACHTGRHSCFFQRLEAGQHWQVVEPVLVDPEKIYTKRSTPDEAPK